MRVDEERAFGLRIEQRGAVLTPFAARQALLRAALQPGIHRSRIENAKHFDEFRIFEIGHEIHKTGGKPDEHPHLMAALFSDAGPLELKRTAECLAPGLHARETTSQLWEHPARCAELWAHGRAFGR